MKLFKTYLLLIFLVSLPVFGQVSEDYLEAEISDDFTITLNQTEPIQSVYKADITSLGFESEEQATKVFGYFLVANLVSNELHYSEGYVLIKINLEYLAEDATHEALNTYLNQLPKPIL